jgi:hypothetical protein
MTSPTVAVDATAPTATEHIGILLWRPGAGGFGLGLAAPGVLGRTRLTLAAGVADLRSLSPTVINSRG